MAQKQQTASGRSMRTDAVNTKLMFVSFALLILIIGPIITGALVNYTETKLLACVNRAQVQVKALRASASIPAAAAASVGITPATANGLDAVVSQLDRAKQHISDLHDIQDAVVGVFGLLGLVAVFYSNRALQDTRATLRDLDAERSKLAAVFNTANVGIILWDKDGSLLDSNPAALHILGQPSESALRRQIQSAPEMKENVPGDETPSPLRDNALLREQGPVWRALRGETFADQEIILTRPDGSRIVTLFGGCPSMRAPDGSVVMGVNVFQDITARRESEQQLRELASADHRRARALESLFETAGHLSISASPQEMHAHLTERVARVLQVDRAILWRCDSDCRALKPLTPAHGFSEDMVSDSEITVQEGEWAHDMLYHNATIRSSAVSEENIGGLYGQMRAWKVTGVLAVPLIAHGKPVGILCAIDKREGDSFTDEDERVLRTFAGQAAFALHSAHQYARARDRSEQLATLARITQVINSSLELETIVPAFLAEARSLIPYSRARLALRPPAIHDESWSQEYPESDEAETDLLRRLRGKTRQGTKKAQRSAQPFNASSTASAQPKTFSPDRGLSYDVPSETHAPADMPLVQVWTAEADSLPLPARSAPQVQTLAPDDALQIALQTGQDQQEGVIAIPLIVNRRLLGALEFKAGDGEKYGEHHLLLAHQAAGQLAAAVQNAHLYEEATHRAEQLGWSMEETHHRIKNNLQAVLAILDLYIMEAEDAGSHPSSQAGLTSRQEGVAREGLAHAMREVRTIAAVHDLLSEDIRNSRVNARHMIDRLVPLLLTASVTAGRRVQVDIQAEDIVLPSKLASALALAANELIVNGVRHGGRGRDEIGLRIELKRQEGQLLFRVTDNGRGFPPGFDLRADAKIGLNLTLTLLERDFSGRLVCANNSEGGGAVVTATLPYSG